MNDIKKKVFVSGNFNILHPGHLRLLRFAKECGHYLVVAVINDNEAKSAAHVPEQLRLEGVQSISWVDEAFITEQTIPNTIKQIQPNIVVKGKEHESLENPEQSVVNSYGGKLVFSSGETTFSSLDLLRKEFLQPSQTDLRISSDYLHRHAFKSESLAVLIEKMNSLKVCVIGDLIIDEYITCEALGMSHEDPTIVVTPIDSTKFIGGSAIVAAHAAGLGAEVEFISITGDDENRDFAQSTLLATGVTPHLVVDDSRPTTLKQRFRSKGKSLLRVSHLHQTAIAQSLQDEVFNLIKESIIEADLLVFSDFNYGCLPQPLVDKIITLAKSNNVMLAADSQSSSQIGDISRFTDMDLLTPTEREARISVRNHEDGLVVLAEKLRLQSNANNILLKLGEEGVLIHAYNYDGSNWLTDRVDALNSAPRDVAGAGDSLLIAAALTLAAGGNIWQAAGIGSLAAALQVGRVGNTPLQSQDLLHELS